jgi:acylaminoacyl-peptidase
LIAHNTTDTLNLPNYTGSMGLGQTYIKKLLGHCGSIDIKDVAESVRELVTRGVAEDGRQVVLGGSHGGFIAAHRMSLSSNLAFSFMLNAHV